MTNIETQDEFEIVSLSYRLVSDANQFEALAGAWGRKLDADGDAELASLKGHVEQVGNLLELTETSVSEDPVDQLIRESNAPIVILTDNNYVVEVNAFWSSQFGHTHGQKIGLDWVAPDSVETFQSVHDSVIQGQNIKHGIIRVATPDGQLKLAEAFATHSKQVKQNVLVVRLLDPVWSDDVSAKLKDLFGLTPAENEVCKLLFELNDTAHIAEKRKTGVRTVRIQLSAIFDKTGAASQVDLIRLLSLICSRARPPVADESRPVPDPSGRENFVSYGNGQRIVYSWIGDPDGIPVILCHGTTIGPFLPTEADLYFRKLGLRAILPIRPGFGKSIGNLKMAPIEDCVEGLCALANSLELETFYILAVTHTGVAATQLALRFPERVKAILYVSGFFPLSAPENQNHLSALQKNVMKMAMQVPWAARMLVQSAIKIVERKGNDWYLERALVGSEKTHKALADQTIMALMRPAVSRVLSQGPDAFVRDLQMWGYKNGLEDLAHLSTPKYLIVGDADPQMSADRVADFRAAAPNAKIDVLKGHTELLYYTAWREMADCLARMVAEQNQS